MFYGHGCFFFFFKQKTAYEMRISDWSSDVCSSDLVADHALAPDTLDRRARKHLPEIRIVERQQVGECRGSELGARQEGAVAVRAVGELVPRTDRKAIVAAIDAVDDPAPQVQRDRTGMPDRQLGYTEIGREQVRTPDNKTKYG